MVFSHLSLLKGFPGLASVTKHVRKGTMTTQNFLKSDDNKIKDVII